MPITAAVGYSGAASGEAGSDASRWERTAAGVPGRAAVAAEAGGQEGFLVTAERFGGGGRREGRAGLAAGPCGLGSHQRACEQVLAHGRRWERPSLRGAPLRARGKQLAPFRSRTQGGSPRRGPWWGGAGRDPLRRQPRRRGLSGAGGSGVRRTGFPLPRVTAQHRPPKPPTAAEKGAGPAAPTRGAAGTAPAPGRAGRGWDPGGGMWRLLAESCSPSGRERSSRRGAGPALPSTPGPAKRPSPREGKRLPRGNHSPRCPGAGRGRPGGPIASPAHSGGRHPGRGREPGAAASRPIHGEFSSVLKENGQSWGCGWQSAQPPSSGWGGGTPLDLQARFSTAETEGGRRGEPGAARSPAASSFTL